MHLTSASANLLTHIFNNTGESVSANMRMGVHKYVGRSAVLAEDAENLLYIPTLLRASEQFTIRVSTRTAFAEGVVTFAIHKVLTTDARNVFASLVHVFSALQNDGALAQFYQA